MFQLFGKCVVGAIGRPLAPPLSSGTFHVRENQQSFIFVQDIANDSLGSWDNLHRKLYVVLKDFLRTDYMNEVGNINGILMIYDKIKIYHETR